ncbi:MAG: chemotaxis protein CheX [Pseudobdellovibrionaceae bacterium]
MSALRKPKTNESLLHDKQLIYAFLDGTVKIFAETASTEIIPSRPFVKSEYEKRGDIAGVLRISAPPLTGRLIVSYESRAIFKVVENMFGEKPTEINSDVSDVVGELTNQIYGQAKTTLSDLGYQFEMSIPKVIVGALDVRNPRYFASLVIPFSLPNKTIFFVEINIE